MIVITDTFHATLRWYTCPDPAAVKPAPSDACTNPATRDALAAASALEDECASWREKFSRRLTAVSEAQKEATRLTRELEDLNSPSLVASSATATPAVFADVTGSVLRGTTSRVLCNARASAPTIAPTRPVLPSLTRSRTLPYPGSVLWYLPEFDDPEAAGNNLALDGCDGGAVELHGKVPVPSSGDKSDSLSFCVCAQFLCLKERRASLCALAVCRSIRFHDRYSEIDGLDVPSCCSAAARQERI